MDTRALPWDSPFRTHTELLILRILIDCGHMYSHKFGVFGLKLMRIQKKNKKEKSPLHCLKKDFLQSLERLVPNIKIK